jgi:two-component system sensor histidine kinase AtoS
MVHDVEHYTALPDPDLRQVKLSELLNSTIDIWKTEHEPIDIEVTMESMPEDPVILVDRNLMRTALVNVLVNAQESIMPKGKVIIGTWWDEKLLVISIKDSGAGITREDLPRVFDPFFTSKTQGAGLGLTTVNHIVSGHGGEVKIYSAPQVGTDVHIRFPALITDGPL